MVKYGFPFRKADNYQFVRTEASNGSLPKIFRTNPFLNWRLIIITDYQFIKEAFSKKELSSRFVTDKLLQVGKLLRKDLNLAKTAEYIMGPSDPLLQNGDCGCDGIAGGPYNNFHRAMRRAYYAVSGLGQSNVSEIIAYNSDQVCDTIQTQMTKGNYACF